MDSNGCVIVSFSFIGHNPAETKEKIVRPLLDVATVSIDTRSTGAIVIIQSIFLF